MLLGLTALATCLFVELLLQQPFYKKLKSLVATSQKSVKVIRSERISDHWKEKVLLSYAFIIFNSSICLLSYLLIAVLPVALISLLAWYFNVNLIVFIVSTFGLFTSSVFALGYLYFRRYFFCA